MVTEDQEDVIAFLESPDTHGGASVERIDTHTAAVFMAGKRAYKLKRAVRFDYLDFSTSDRRRRLCEAELRLNRRTAPDLYRRVVAVTRRPGGGLELGGNGEPIDWVIEMTRFPQECLFDRLAAAGQLALDLVAQLAERIGVFHSSAEQRFDHGGQRGMRWVADGNAAGFDEFGHWLDPSARARLADLTNRTIDERATQLDARVEDGCVRHCHGDLHLGNIVLLDGQPTLFDGVEFNDEIACIDVLYDIAFLVMDLWHRDLPRHANVLMNRYLAETGDLDGLGLFPLFLSCRAAVRAKTSATASTLQSTPEQQSALERLTGVYFSMAERLLQPPPPRLVAIGGLSGSGKSTLALALAPAEGPVPGAVVLRSDEARKRLHHVSPSERLGPSAYAPEVSGRVYRTLADGASRVLRAGHSVVVDAVYSDAVERRNIERVARDASVPFIGLWLDAPEATLVARVATRHHDASDADAGVVRAQHAKDLGQIGWRTLDASGSPEQIRQAARDMLGF